MGNRTLRVYHTPEMQKIVADVVQRFTSSEAATYTFSMRVVTLDSPDWRTAAQRLLRPVPVQTSGVNAWMLPKENAAILLGELRRRGDYREHSSPYLMVNNGQSSVVSAMRGRPYVRDVIPRPDTAAGFDPSPGQVDEGFALDFSPLLSADRRLIDATIKCDIDQIEKMIPVLLDMPTPTLPRQRTQIESPQIVHYRFYERFRWPIDQVSGGGDGHGGAADPGGRRAAVGGPAAADRQLASPGRPVGIHRVQGSSRPRDGRFSGRFPRSAPRGQELSRPLLSPCSSTGLLVTANRMGYHSVLWVRASLWALGEGIVMDGAPLPSDHLPFSNVWPLMPVLRCGV